MNVSENEKFNIVVVKDVFELGEITRNRAQNVEHK
jgi:hypothetical protein